MKRYSSFLYRGGGIRFACVRKLDADKANLGRYDSRDTTNGSSIVGRLLIRCLVPPLKFTLRAEPASPLSHLLTLLLRQSTATTDCYEWP